MLTFYLVTVATTTIFGDSVQSLRAVTSTFGVYTCVSFLFKKPTQ